MGFLALSLAHNLLPYGLLIFSSNHRRDLKSSSRKDHRNHRSDDSRRNESHHNPKKDLKRADREARRRELASYHRKFLRPGTEFAFFRREHSSSSDDESLSIEERDACTIFVWQLAARIQPRDLEDFFSVIGKVRDVRLIMDIRTQRSKGIAYVEFSKQEYVNRALALNGTKLLGVPIQIQTSQADKNRLYSASNPINASIADNLPMKLYVGSLHYNVPDSSIRGLFEQFGKIDEFKIIRDPGSAQHHGYGFIKFNKGIFAKNALENLNGYELAGRPIKVNYVIDKPPIPGSNNNSSSREISLDIEEADRAGLNLGSTGRLALMAKLAEGTGMQLPRAAQNALAMTSVAPGNSVLSNPVVPSNCIVLSNLFDTRENPPYDEISEDVYGECIRYGTVLHHYVDRTPSSRGKVYVKLSTLGVAAMIVNKMNGRFFSGRVIAAEFVPFKEYDRLFPDSNTIH